MKKYNKKNQPRNHKPQQNRIAASKKLPRPKLLAEVKIVSNDAITLSRAEYDTLVNNAHLVNDVEQLCLCSGKYTAATFLRHMFAHFMTDTLDDAPGLDTLVALDRAEYDTLNRATGLLDALAIVAGRHSDYKLSEMLEYLYCADEDEKVEKG